MIVLLAGLVLAGCHSAREFDYNGAKLDTINSISIDNRTPYPVPRDSWRLGPTREASVEDVAIKLAASEDGSTIMFQLVRYPFGAKSKLMKQSTERSSKALGVIVKDLQQAGFKISKRIAIIDNANVIGYKIGGPARVIGFYIFSEPGAYDALLPILDEQAIEWETAQAEMAQESSEVVNLDETEPEAPVETEHEMEE